MNQKTIARLLALNRQFYRTFAGPFAGSRTVSDSTLTSILPHIPQGARVLDLGCGNGRLALLLDRERAGSAYVGVDAVPELIERARAETAHVRRVEVTLLVADVTAPGWAEALAPTSFDRVVLLAMLHHIPGFDLRAQVLRDAAGLLQPAGRLILSGWQFLASERMRRKIVSWAEAGIAAEELEPGDYLLDWKRGGRGLRYCHQIDDSEIERLAAASGCAVQETFRAGGREGDLGLFALLALHPAGDSPPI